MHRAREIYQGRGRYFVTVGCPGRRAVFARPRTAEWAVSPLLSTAAAYRFSVHAWRVMPDHVHILAESTDETCNLLLFIRQFKLRMSREDGIATAAVVKEFL
jgi:REP element-mobilizing transposase RayT